MPAVVEEEEVEGKPRRRSTVSSEAERQALVSEAQRRINEAKQAMELARQAQQVHQGVGEGKHGRAPGRGEFACVRGWRGMWKFVGSRGGC